jgi:uncharacterized protein (TIGR02646 family)
VIPVVPAPEPPGFDAAVRKPGGAWLKKRGLPINGPLPSGAKPDPLWRLYLPQLHSSYHGICAYVAVDIPLVTGQPSADHFVAKSRDAALIYEWRNYRLACSKMNSRKRDFADVFDPFEIAHETFHLDLVSGAIRPNPQLDQTADQLAWLTIERLDLDDAECRRLRASWYSEYLESHISEDYMRRKSPFVWSEAVRQNALRE